MANIVFRLRHTGEAALAGNILHDVTIHNHTDIAGWASLLAGEAEQRNMRIMTWHNIATMEPMVNDTGQPLNLGVFGWSDQTLAGWQSLDAAASSPLLRACRVASEPLWINHYRVMPDRGSRFVDPIDLAGLENLVGARAAIIMPVRMAFGILGAAFVTSTDPEKENLSVEFRAFTDNLAAPLQGFVRSYAQLTYDERYLPTDCLLSGREIECLNWIAQGKTDSEISIILGCSHAGVRYHITRVCAKLGASNRSQAVFKASQLGYLGVPSRPPLKELERSGDVGQQKLGTLRRDSQINQLPI